MVRDSVRKAEFFAQGRVTRIDTDQTPHVFTVSTGSAERTMFMLTPAAVGDVVFFLDLVSPLGLGPAVGS
jgi:hypothetical protein